jgi:hypothetical protein
MSWVNSPISSPVRSRARIASPPTRPVPTEAIPPEMAPQAMSPERINPGLAPGIAAEALIG